jgi:hypothetical protein
MFIGHWPGRLSRSILRAGGDDERGLVLGFLAFLGGLILLSVAVWQWSSVHFGPLDYARTMRWVIPGVTLTAVGFQTILSSLFVSIFGVEQP